MTHARGIHFIQAPVFFSTCSHGDRKNDPCRKSYAALRQHLKLNIQGGIAMDTSTFQGKANMKILALVAMSILSLTVGILGIADRNFFNSRMQFFKSGLAFSA
jgi:hypothetical protein